MFSKRIHPSKIAEVLALLSNGRVVKETHGQTPIVSLQMQYHKAIRDNKALLEDVERLTKDNENLQEQVQRVMGMSDDTKVYYWRNLFLGAKSRLDNNGSI